MRIKEFISLFETIAPEKLAVKEDKVGLQIGDENNTIKNIFVTLDVTEKAVDQAIKNKANLIVSHHPIIFDPITKIDYKNPIARILVKLLSNKISVYVAHTNLDIVEGGVCDVLSDVFGLKNLKPLKNFGYQKLLKLSVFVPQAKLENVRIAVCRAGAGNIGNYSDCSFLTSGIGTYKPLKGSKPYKGQAGKVERSGEAKLEVLVEEEKLSSVISAMKKVHPYEEVAFDIFELENKGKPIGMGRVGQLKQKTSIDDLVEIARKRLKSKNIIITGNFKKKVKTISTNGGSARSVVVEAAKKSELLICGELNYAARLEAEQMGLAVIEAGHFETERVIVPVLVKKLKDKVGYGIGIYS